MQSANGTYINGIEIKDQKLTPGDELRVGESSLVYEQRIAFEQDDVLGAKHAGAGVDSTAVSGMGLPQLIRLAIKEADGDCDQAAEKLGIKVETVRKIMDEESD
jgi:pSer/pThr/pTyr-binding forkhead associated (FHA) protein